MNAATPPGLVPRLRCWLLAGLFAVPAAAQDAAGGASTLARGPLSGEQAAGYASGLLLVFGMLALLVWLARWLQNRGSLGRGGLRVLSSIGLGGKERLMVVDVEGERLLIGVAPGGIQLIRTLPAAEQQAPRPAAPGQERGWLARVLARESSS